MSNVCSNGTFSQMSRRLFVHGENRAVKVTAKFDDAGFHTGIMTATCVVMLGDAYRA